jgi:hypothetical protein
MYFTSGRAWRNRSSNRAIALATSSADDRHEVLPGLLAPVKSPSNCG